jgi:hypothetical protein
MPQDRSHDLILQEHEVLYEQTRLSAVTPRQSVVYLVSDIRVPLLSLVFEPLLLLFVEIGLTEVV